ncbi:uncharacterized protein LOC121860792 [Homarus americanus]|uniref:uncharacterized protein LOC121860792 n=1 Tax=Homarus americanus TaxID=6706 RepID=UPI001C466978|nr:uncharacterized protein LOC121855861 isoform X1 [Homarus americanus]XP_042214106.1 uncharacterized protein LOC121860792 [Homarus americanus]
MEHDSIGRGALRWFNVKISLLLVIATRLALANSNANMFYAVPDLCQDTFLKQHNRMIEGAVVVSEGERNVKCVVTFQTDSILQRFMLRFERLQLDCNDHLFIYDGAYDMGAHKADLSCRNTLQNVGTMYTQTNHVTLRYVTDQWGPKENGFKLLITAFKDKKHTCLHFRCETTNFCVDRELTCDGVNHCGDGSDESTNLARCPPMPLWEVLGVSGALLITIVASVAFLCCACGVTVVVCVYRRNRALHRPPPQTQPAYPLEAGGRFGTNGTFGTLLVEKPPPYPGAPQHTSVIPPDSSPGNLVRPALGVGCSTLLRLTARCCLSP